MRESSTYQYILDEGRIEQAQHDVLFVGRRRLGAPRKAVETALKEITDLERLKRLMGRVLDASSWDELLQTR